MGAVFTILHLLVCLLLVLAVLLQSGKGSGMAAAFGGLSSSSILGGRSATTFLSKATAILATVFLLSCMVQSLTYVSPVEKQATSATERMLQKGGETVAPTPFETPGSGEAAPAQAPEQP